MSTKDAICKRYEPQLAAIAALDRAYYTSEMPTATDRAAYLTRQEVLECIRGCLYEELSAAKTTKRPPQRLILATPAGGAAVPNSNLSRSTCILTHDLLNYLSVVLGRCQLLSEAARNDPNAERQLAGILEAVQKMSRRLRESCPLPADPPEQTKTAHG